MSYLVLARKWRPQTLDEVVGQPHVTRTLENAILSQRIAHAYLFTGARGVGKTSVARILAKALNCEEGPSPRPCNRCSNCREITRGNAVDVLEIDGASNRGIDSIRELRETVRYRPAKSAYKVYIIDEVHMLTAEAFNALLKTLEEPPRHVLFVLATTEPHKIPATILSRCQRFDFRRIPAKLVTDQLKRIVDAEGASFSDSILYAIAREAEGSMRDAQSLLEQLLAFRGEGMNDEEILDILGVVDRRSVYRVGKAVLDGDTAACLQVVEDLYRRGVDSKRFCQQLAEYFRGLLFLSLDEGGGRGWLDVPEEERAVLKEESQRTTSEQLYLYFQVMLQGEEDIRRSTLPRIALEMLLLRMTQLPRLESLEKLLEKLERLEGAPPGSDRCREDTARAEASPPARPRPSAPAPASPSFEPEEEAPWGLQPPLPEGVAGSAPPGESLEEAAPPPFPASPSGKAGPVRDPVEDWAGFLKWLAERHAVLAAKLDESKVRRAGGDAQRLVIDVLEVYEDSLKGPETRNLLSRLAGEYFGRDVSWDVRSQPAVMKNGAVSKGREARDHPRRLVLENPGVQQALEILGGELVEIRPRRPEGK
ncbi:DNA polymerase III subunit gamma/tau [Desulfoglaeba alkanexedens]|uniref:DNA polymerase III subunit gamma/tau n=1 Tax=Desulfoglaeba alkanexedens ALDC TaxID=980445 RepID=A0A4P8L4U0_9BACT|nr:DNA polymerase III subunit gamma/tau [Desulfoglaeba alkanexedens]QCQ22065.1 DNA polymerase III subunit gamma/tau [Desulfoglaeba alkanexedens ALDC]